MENDVLKDNKEPENFWNWFWRHPFTYTLTTKTFEIGSDAVSPVTHLERKFLKMVLMTSVQSHVYILHSLYALHSLQQYPAWVSWRNIALLQFEKIPMNFKARIKHAVLTLCIAIWKMTSWKAIRKRKCFEICSDAIRSITHLPRKFLKLVLTPSV